MYKSKLLSFQISNFIDLDVLNIRFLTVLLLIEAFFVMLQPVTILLFFLNSKNVPKI